MSPIFRLAAWLVAASLATACGGGGGGSSDEQVAGPPSLALLAGVAPGGAGSVDGPADVARFDGPAGIAVDAAGNVYVCDLRNATIRRIDAQGVVTTLAGLAHVQGWVDGTGSQARFRRPLRLALDSSANLYVADNENNSIRKVTPAGSVSTYAGSPDSGSDDGPAASARFKSPTAVAVDAVGNVFVSDSGNNTIRRISTQGVVTTIAGAVGQSGSDDGPALQARFGAGTAIASDGAGGLWIADAENKTIRRLTPDGFVRTVAGRVGVSGSADGTGAEATFDLPFEIASDASGNAYVSDRRSYAFRKVTASGVVTTISGSPDLGTGATVNEPHPLAVSADGGIHFVDRQLNTVMAMSPAGVVSTFAGVASAGTGFVDGPGPDARFNGAAGIATDTTGIIYVFDGGNGAVRTISRDGHVATLATVRGGSGIPGGIAVDAQGTVYVAYRSLLGPRFFVPAKLFRITPDGNVGEVAVLGDINGNATLDMSAHALAVDRSGNLYIGDTFRILKLTPQGGLTTFAGSSSGSDDGVGTAARFGLVGGFALGASGDLFVADPVNHSLRRITPAGEVTTIARNALFGGSSDPMGPLLFSPGPVGDVAVAPDGRVFVTDAHTVRVVAADGSVTTLAGTPAQDGFTPGPLPGTLSGPFGIALSGREAYLTMSTGVAVIRNIP